MHTRKITFIALSIAIILAAFLRFYQLGQNPPSLTWDEVAWGYNAYSIAEGGRDEFGRFLPVSYIESFGDFKPPVYAYLDVFPVKIFGLNEFSVRFPSVFFGVLTVILTYLLVKRIFWKEKEAELYALASAFILALSPWHIMLSRAAFEANVASFFIVCGVWLFLAGCQDKKWYLVLSVVPFVLSLYTFNTARIVVPLLVFFLAFLFRKKLINAKKETVIAVLVGVFLILPILPFLASPQASLRFKEVNIFSDPDVVTSANQQIANDKNALWSKALHNRRLIYGISYLRHYLDNLNPTFLFIKGDGNPKFSIQTVGQMYIWDIPFFIAGIFILFRKRQKYWWIIPIWLVIGIIPAGTARETPHALRIEAALPTFQILTAVGAVTFLLWISKIKFKYPIYAITFLFLFFNFLYFYHDHFAHYGRKFSGEWQYGYKESIEYVKSVQDKYQKVEITTSLGRPYIYYLFYNKYNPEKFRDSATVKRDIFGFVEVEGFDKYIFSKNLSKRGENTLYINVPSNVPSSARILKTFRLLNGDVSLVAYTL